MIRLAQKYDIVLPYVFFAMISFLDIVSNEVRFVLITAYLGYIIFLDRGRVIVPRVRGLNFYLIYSMIIALFGLIIYPMRYVFRDLFYILPTIELTVLGYYLFLKSKSRTSLLKTIVYTCFIMACYNMLQFVLHPSTILSLTTIRKIANVGIYEIVVAFLVMFVELLDSTDIIKFKYKYLVLSLFLIQIIISFSRSVWVEVFISVFVIFIWKNGKKISKRLVSTLLVMIIVLCVLFLIVVNYMPSSIFNDYVHKLLNSFSEINSSRAFNSVQEVTNNLRAYEIQSAQKQWLKYNLFKKLFGAGLGKGIYLKYLPSTWVNIVVNNEIPLAHNAYYTYLVKGGIVGLASIIYYLISPCITALKMRYQGRYYKMLRDLLMMLGLMMLTQSYIVRGPITQNANVSWSMLIGWVSAWSNVKENEENEK